ncbi:hypothetical protein HOK51_08445 [Candidatus Woesearchaeota archaeon]|jgi:hypothetical protein|nr:hypothetical protein [Candidatus Woesearchaeota archaeon]MBT6519855.1 hypothetical protein [Candidatus Woesearchaeota archaeon]MBT7367147.1 hypothetical protein [Candidatus Woesearchaeota archaeon]
MHETMKQAYQTAGDMIVCATKVAKFTKPYLQKPIATAKMLLKATPTYAITMYHIIKWETSRTSAQEKLVHDKKAEEGIAKLMDIVNSDLIAIDLNTATAMIDDYTTDLEINLKNQQ